MNGVSLSTGSQFALPGLTTPLPIINTQNQGLQFSDHIPRTVLVKAPTMGRRERKLRNYKRLIRRARRNRASEPCRMYAGVGSFLRIHQNGTVDGEFSKNPGELSIVQFIGLATAIGLVRIKGEVSKNYLCMNKHGILYGHPNMTDECIFREHQEDNHYNYYSSHKYSKLNERRRGRRKKKGTKFWFVALNRNGTSRPAHRSRMDQMFTKFLLNRCKKIAVSEPAGPFHISKFSWPPTGSTFDGKLEGGIDTGEEEKDDEKDTGKGKGKGKKRRCKGKRKGKKCRKGKKDNDKKDSEKEDKKNKDEKDEKAAKKKDKNGNENETICKRRWRNRKNRRDYVDEPTAVKRRRRCKERLKVQRLKERLAKKEAKKKVDTPVAPDDTANEKETKAMTTPKLVTTTTTTSTTTTTPTTTTSTTSSTTSLPPATEQVEADLKMQSNRFNAATDFRSVFANLMKVIETNNKEMLSNFSSVNGGLSLASMLRLGRQSGQPGGSEPAVSGASLGSEHKHRHHHGSDGRRRHARALTDSHQEEAKSPSDFSSNLSTDTQSSETGFTDLASDSDIDTASKPSVTSRTSPGKRSKSSQFELLLKVLNHLESQSGEARPDGSKNSYNSDNYKTGVLIVGNGPVGRTPSRRQRLRKRHRNKSASDRDTDLMDT